MTAKGFLYIYIEREREGERERERERERDQKENQATSKVIKLIIINRHTGFCF